jgi:hypothetical protein
MKFDCATLEQIELCVDLVKSCDIVRSGAIRISTPFLYPNGDSVDVFLYPKPSNLFDEYHLSDCGQTYIYLKGAQVGMLGTTRKREIVGDIASQLNVRLSGGEIFVAIHSDIPEGISDAILRIAQACVRISDFATHQRLRSANPFRDDVEDFFEAQNFGFSKDVKVLGAYNLPVRMDFEVKAGENKAYVNVLAAMNLTAAHSAANEIFTKLYDISQVEQKGHKLITVFNSASRAVRSTDIRRLGELSNVVSYPQEQHLLARILSEEAA